MKALPKEAKATETCLHGLYTVNGALALSAQASRRDV